MGKNLDDNFKKEKRLIHCKSCRGVLVRDMDTKNMDGLIFFLIRCPLCQEDCRIKMEASRRRQTKII